MISSRAYQSLLCTLLSMAFFAGSTAVSQEATECRRLSDAVEYRQYSVSSPAGRVTVRAVLVDNDAIRRGFITVDAVPTPDGSSPAGLGQSLGALAAINGPYFASAGGRLYPVGFAAVNGKLVQLGNLSRPLVGVNRQGEFKITVAHPQAFVTSDSYFDPVFLWGINQPAGLDHVTMYDRRWGNSVSFSDGLAVAVEPYEPQKPDVIVVGPQGPRQEDWDGAVSARITSGPAEVPDNGFVLLFRGRSLPLAGNYQIGAKTAVYCYELPEGWQAMRWMVTLGPWFIHEGSFRDFSSETAYDNAVLGRANRSVIGTTWNDEVFFMTTFGAPLTVRETAEVLMECNVREAVMCDGGGSSSLWVRGVGSFGSGREVPISFVVRETDSPPGEPAEMRVWRGTIRRPR